MNNTKGDVALMNISQEQIISMILCSISMIYFFAFLQPQYVLRNFGHFSASCSVYIQLRQRTIKGNDLRCSFVVNSKGPTPTAMTAWFKKSSLALLVPSNFPFTTFGLKPNALLTVVDLLRFLKLAGPRNKRHEQYCATSSK